MGDKSRGSKNICGKTIIRPDPRPVIGNRHRSCIALTSHVWLF